MSDDLKVAGDAMVVDWRQKYGRFGYSPARAYAYSFDSWQHAPRVPLPDPEPLVAKRVEDYDVQPYVVRVGGKDVRSFTRREAAIQHAKRVRGEVWHVGLRFSALEGSEQVLPRDDRARGKSALLRGQSSKVFRARVATGKVEVRVW